MQQDLNIISKLDDEPNDHQGLTPAELKARFDMAGNAIQAYINDTLLPEMERAISNIESDGFVPATRTVCGKALSEDIVLTAHDVGALPADTPVPAALADLNEDSTHRTVTDAEKAAWNAKSELILGETEATAYRGDRGKIAYDHSRETGNPHGATPADIGAAEAAHTHGLADVSGLEAALDGKANVTHTHGNLTVNGKALAGAVTLSAADVGAAAATHAHAQSDVAGLTAALAGKAESEHGHGSLTGDGKIGSAEGRAVYTGAGGVLQAGTLPVSAGGTGAATAQAALLSLGGVPSSRKINGKALTADITLTLDDVPGGSVNVAFTAAEKEKLAGLEPYTLPVASAGRLGGVRVGAGLQIDENGVLSAATEIGDTPGDMMRAVYDPDRDGVVRAADYAYAVDWENVLGRPAIPAALADLNEDSTHRTVTDAEKAAWNAKSELILGETAATAYRGDRGKTAYDHSRETGNPHGTTAADIGAAQAGHTHGLADVSGLEAALDGKAPAAHTHGNLTVNGKALAGAVTLSAADVGAAAATHTHTKNQITDFPASMTPAAHKDSHKTGGGDALSPSDIGAAAATHTHAQSDVTGLIAALAGKAESEHGHAASDIAGLTALLAQAAKFETGSYVGTGTYGVQYPNSLQFGFEPKFVFVGCNSKTQQYPYYSFVALGMFMVRPSSQSTNILSTDTAFFPAATFNMVQWSGNTVSWYANPEFDVPTADELQFNDGGVTYHYIAIG